MCERSLKFGTDLQFACCVMGWPGAVDPFRHVMPFLRSFVCHPMAADVAASCRNTFLIMHSAITYTLKHLCVRVCENGIAVDLRYPHLVNRVSLPSPLPGF